MTNRAQSSRLLAIVALFVVLAIGCNGGTPELGNVTGTVRLDGKPLVGAQVEFQPQKRLPPSYGATDNLGRYELEYTKDKLGAAVGAHTVRITTQTTGRDELGNEIQVPQRVPERYNDRSELIRQVKSGENVFDFDLQSEPETQEPAAEQAETQEPEAAEAEMEKPGDAGHRPEAARESPQAESVAAEEPEAEEPGQEDPKATQP